MLKARSPNSRYMISYSSSCENHKRKENEAVGETKIENLLIKKSIV